MKSFIRLTKISSQQQWQDFAEFVFEYLHTGTNIPKLTGAALEENKIGFLAYDQDEIVGSVALRLTSKSGEFELRNLVVHPDSRGLGIGMKLVKKMLEEAGKKGFTSCIIHARVSAMAFYEKLNPIHTGEVDTRDGIEREWLQIGL